MTALMFAHFCVTSAVREQNSHWMIQEIIQVFNMQARSLEERSALTEDHLGHSNSTTQGQSVLTPQKEQS